MSKSEWEHGEIVLPAKAYSKFRQDLIKAWNNWQLELLEKAKVAVELLRKAKEPVNRNVNNVMNYLYDNDTQFKNTKDSELYAIVHLIPHKDGKWFVPKKQDLKILPISKGTRLDCDEATITLNDDTHSLTWHVMENNHACDRAHEHPIANVMFRMLNNVQWVRGSGGQIVGNDEYNQDNDCAGGGGNYVKQTFSPKSKKIVETYYRTKSYYRY
jgi:hypothetical protein